MEPMFDPLFQTSVGHLRAGLSADCQQRFIEAAMAYMDGAPLLLQVARGENVGTPIKQLLRSKSQLYLNRIQLIKARLEAKEEVPANPASDPAQPGVDQLEGDCGELVKTLNYLPLDCSLPGVKGAELAKDFLWKNVVLPLTFPGFPDPVTRVRKGILLYGLPGCGKTLLMCAVARAVSCPVFRVTASDLISRWDGTERCVERVRDVFRCVRQNQPCLLCVDDLEMLCPSGKSAAPDGTATAVREELFYRLKEATAENQVTVIAATQKPWALTGNLRRRFDRRFYLTLPSADERAEILSHHFADVKHKLSDTDFDLLGQATWGYTGSDLAVVVRSCSMAYVRALQKASHFRKVMVSEAEGEEKGEREMLVPCESGEPGAVELTVEFLNTERIWELPVTRMTVDEELKQTKASMCDADVQQMDQFYEEFGQDD